MPTLTTPWFHYVHMPKCSGGYIAEVLRAMGVVEHVAGDDGALAHLPAYRLPADRPIVGSIRDPWSWYASLASYWGQSAVGRAWLRPYREAAAREGASIIEAMAFPVANGVRAVGIRPPPEETLAGSGWSLYSWNVVHSYFAEDALYVAPSRLDARWDDYYLPDFMLDGSRPLEALRAVFRAMDVRLAPSAWRGAATVERRNASRWAHDARETYDPKLAARIGREDAWIARRFGVGEIGKVGRLVYGTRRPALAEPRIAPPIG